MIIIVPVSVFRVRTHLRDETDYGVQARDTRHDQGFWCKQWLKRES